MADIKLHPLSYYTRQGIYFGGSGFGKFRRGLGWLVSRAPQIGSAIKTDVDVIRTLCGGKNDVVGPTTLRDRRFKYW